MLDCEFTLAVKVIDVPWQSEITRILPEVEISLMTGPVLLA
jgi:hypothetical protein